MRYIENRYLGGFAVSLQTVLSGSKFEGMVRLNRPLVLQNYKVIQDDVIFFEKHGDLEDCYTRPEEQIPTYLNVTISMEPLITLPRNNRNDYYQGFEQTPFLQAGTEFVDSVQSKFQKDKRYPRVFLENLDGKSVFIPKYLSPQRPPPEVYRDNDTNSKAIEKAARYVSLIPFIDDSKLFKDMPDMTCTSQQFLDLGMGDYEEHAILLCNYFNFIDRAQGR